VDVAAAFAGHDRQGGRHQVRADGVARHPVMGVDHVLQCPAGRAPGDLRVPDGMAVSRFDRDEPGEAFPPALDQIEPVVLTQRIVAVGQRRQVEQLLHAGDVVGAHLPANLDPVHEKQGTDRSP